MSTKELFPLIKSEVISTTCINDVEIYLSLLNKMKKIIPKGSKQTEFPLGHRKWGKFLQSEVKEIFKEFCNKCEAIGLSDELFDNLRKNHSREDLNGFERPIIANLDSCYSIAKNYDFKLHLYKSTEQVQYFLSGRENFLENLKLLEEKV